MIIAVYILGGIALFVLVVIMGGPNGLSAQAQHKADAWLIRKMRESQAIAEAKGCEHMVEEIRQAIEREQAVIDRRNKLHGWDR